MGGLFHNLRYPQRCFMVCAIARTGSNLLCDGLHATRSAGRGQQYFLPKFEDELGAKYGLDAKEDFAGYVRGVVQAAAFGNRVFSFKVMAWYLHNFLARLRATGAFGSGSDRAILGGAFPRLEFVQILRRDKVQQAISKARAMQTGLWKIQPGNEALSEPAYDADLITRCLDAVREDEAVWSEFFARENLSPHIVWYEDLCANYETVIRSVLDFLKIKLPRGQQITAPRTIRQADDISRQWEERYREGNPSLPNPAIR
jgi:trehalose 2-sulfotransferase